MIRSLLLLLAGLVAAGVNTGNAATTVPSLSETARALEIQAKEQRLREFLTAHGLDGVLLGTQRNFAWLTGGGDNHVVFNTEEGSALLLWTPEEKYVIAANNEIARVTEEELTGLDYEPTVFRWHEDLSENARGAAIRRLIASRRIGADLPMREVGVAYCGNELAMLRWSLTTQEIELYRWLCHTTAQIVENACREITPGETETAIQATVARGLFAHDILPTVLLVSADERIASYKHAITKNAPVRHLAMVTVCARKWGLVTAVTRLVHFGELPEATRAKQAALNEIYATFLRETRPDVRVENIVARVREAYAKADFADAWDAHHLGGAIGYKEREYKAYPGCEFIVQENQAFAWNPTLPGVKIEDTILVRRDGFEVLTHTGNWPCATVMIDGQPQPVPQILIK